MSTQTETTLYGNQQSTNTMVVHIIRRDIDFRFLLSVRNRFRFASPSEPYMSELTSETAAVE